MVDGAEKMWICTIHSMCVRILRQYAERIGYNKNFSIYSETERNNVIKKSFAECGETDEKLLKNVKFHIANAKTLGLAPEAYAEKNRDVKNIGSIERVYAAYQAHLKAYNALDFDDLLTETLRLLETDKDALEYLSGRFRYIHVDEFQDTNRVQYEIVRLLSSVHGNPFAWETTTRAFTAGGGRRSKISSNSKRISRARRYISSNRITAPRKIF